MSNKDKLVQTMIAYHELYRLYREFTQITVVSSTLDHLYNKYQVDTPDTLFSQCIRNPTQFTNVIHYYRGQLHILC